jgi:Zn-dependent protease
MMEAAKPRFGNIFLLYKFLPKLFAVFGKLLKSAKAVKIGLAGASMVSYSVIFSWKFALILMFMLFVHESGHIWAMKLYGIKTKGIYFLPFIGGAAVAEEAFPSRKAEVVTAIMGPIWGFGLAVVTGILYGITGNVLFAAASSWMAMINLFNLLPINPLDGGRIMKSIAFSMHSVIGVIFLIIGSLVSIFFALVAGYNIFIFLMFIGLIELQAEYSNRKKIKKQIDEHNAQVTENAKIASAPYVINLAKNVLDTEIVPVKTGIEISKTSNENQAEKFYSPEEKIEYKEIPSMGKLAIFGSAFAYFLITLFLWLNMEIMSHVPGAAMALDLLKG